MFNEYGLVEGLILGIVKDINDPQKLNRVKVTIPNSAIETPYIPVAQSIASNKVGNVIVPNVGDVVIVGFINGRIESGVVLGSIYYGENKPPLAVNKKNEITKLKTKGGTEVIFDDKKDKQKATVKTKKGMIIELDESKDTITLSDKKTKNFIKIETKKQNIAITTGKKIFLKAGNDSLTIENGKGLTFKTSAGNFKIDANNVQMKAKANAKIQANANVEIKGTAKAAVQSSGQAVFKGSINQIG